MVGHIIFSDINNVIARVCNAVESFINILFIIVKVESSIGTEKRLVAVVVIVVVVVVVVVVLVVVVVVVGVGPCGSTEHYLATSAYVSIAFMLFLFFSATGMIVFLAPNKSPTFAKVSCRNVRRYPRR